MGIGFQSPYPFQTHREKYVRIPTESPYPQNPEILYTGHLQAVGDLGLCAVCLLG